MGRPATMSGHDHLMFEDLPDISSEIANTNVASFRAAYEAGHTAWALRNMPRPGDIRGARYLDGLPDPRNPYGRIRAAVLATSPRAVVAGWSAAVMFGVPASFIDGTSDGREPRPVVVHPRGTHHQRAGIRFTYSALADDDIVMHDRVLVTTGVRTTFDCIRLARGRSEALAHADACVRFGLTTPAELGAYARDRRRWPGIRLVRELIPLLSPFAESPMESWMRLVWIDAKLPEPLVNPRIVGPDGVEIARVDLLDPRSGLVGEYDGFWHRLGERPAKDRARGGLLRSCGFTIVTGTAEDLTGGGSGLDVRLRQRHQDLLRVGARPADFVRIVPQQPRY